MKCYSDERPSSTQWHCHSAKCRRNSIDNNDRVFIMNFTRNIQSLNEYVNSLSVLQSLIDNEAHCVRCQWTLQFSDLSLQPILII